MRPTAESGRVSGHWLTALAPTPNAPAAFVAPPRCSITKVFCMMNNFSMLNMHRASTLNVFSFSVLNMNKDFGIRLAERIRASGMKQKDIAKRAEVSAGLLSLWKGGGIKEPEARTLRRVCEVINTNPDYLLSGEMPKDWRKNHWQVLQEAVRPTAESIAAEERVMTFAEYGEPTYEEEISNAMQKAQRSVSADIPASASVGAYDKLDEIGLGSYVSVKVYDVEASAGHGNFVWVENETDPILFRLRFFNARGKKPENARAIYVRGRSMEPLLEDGDTVLIDISDTRVIEGEIYAVMLWGELYIKHIDRIRDGFVLRSANPEFGPREVVGEDLEGFRVLGRKFWRAG